MTNFPIPVKILHENLLPGLCSPEHDGKIFGMLPELFRSFGHIPQELADGELWTTGDANALQPPAATQAESLQSRAVLNGDVTQGCKSKATTIQFKDANK